MLQQVFQKGPFTQGIFRKSASARLVKELREQLDAGADVALDVVPVLVTAALLKDFLRSLPAPVLGSGLGDAWLDAWAAASAPERLARLKVPNLESCPLGIKHFSIGTKLEETGNERILLPSMN